jgi:endonuclease/exonuclease/phosphatase family metal-dependent hydrolase
VVAIQEVVARDPGGAQAVARLAGALNRRGSKWNYTVSDITSGTAYKAERYAFLWKTSVVKKLGDAWLEKQYALEIDREPYYATFNYQGRQITLVNFHAITKNKQPETEIKYFKYLPAEYPQLHLVFCGDFNCPQSHSVFTPLKAMGYQPALTGQKTSLRKQCTNGNCLASEFDNIFAQKSSFLIIKSGIVAFYQSFPYFEAARKISDHVPVWAEVEWRESEH